MAVAFPKVGIGLNAASAASLNVSAPYLSPPDGFIGGVAGRDHLRVVEGESARGMQYPKVLAQVDTDELALDPAFKVFLDDPDLGRDLVEMTRLEAVPCFAHHINKPASGLGSGISWLMKPPVEARLTDAEIRLVQEFIVKRKELNELLDRVHEVFEDSLESDGVVYHRLFSIDDNLPLDEQVRAIRSKIRTKKNLVRNVQGAAAEIERDAMSLIGELEVLASQLRHRRALVIEYIRECCSHKDLDPFILIDSGIEQLRDRIGTLARSLDGFYDVNPARAILDAVADARPYYSRCVADSYYLDAAVNFLLPAELPELKVSNDVLYHLVYNHLLGASNAIRHHPDRLVEKERAFRGSIHLNGRLLTDEGARYFALSIKDDGVGMVKEGTGIFPYTMARELAYITPGHQRLGWGVGTMISLILVMGAGGRVFVKTAPKKGTTFDYWLPLA